MVSIQMFVIIGVVIFAFLVLLSKTTKKIVAKNPDSRISLVVALGTSIIFFVATTAYIVCGLILLFGMAKYAFS